MNAAQMLSVVLEAPGSPTVRFGLEDLETKSKVEVPAAAVTASGKGFSARSAPLELTAGHRYEATATAQLGAAIQVQRWTFRRIAFDVTAAAAAFRPTTAIRTDPGSWRVVPEIELSGFEVSSGETEHSGVGPVGQQLPINSAVIQYWLGDETKPRTVRLYADLVPEPVAYRMYGKSVEEPANSVSMTGQVVRVAPVMFTLPPAATRAEVRPDTHLATAVVTAGGCGFVPCSPDPFPFYFPEDFAADILDFQRAAETDPVIGEAPTFVTTLPGVPTSGTLDPEPHPNWSDVSLDTAVLAVGADEDASGAAAEVLVLREGVAYEGSLPPVTPAQFDEACARGFACTNRAAEAQSIDALRRRCLRPDGRERIYPRYEDCHQYEVITALKAAEPDCCWNPPRSYTFQFAAISQIGYADNWSSDNPEPIGLAWDDGGGWAYDNYNNALYSYDTYWCHPDYMYRYSNNSFDETWHYHVNSPDQLSASPTIQIAPYGMGHHNPRQWVLSTTFMPPDWTTCRFQDDAGPGFTYGTTTTAISRLRARIITSRWATVSRPMSGTAVGSAGHVWRRYDFDWQLEFTFQCGGGCGAGFGFTFTPYSQEKSKNRQYVMGYKRG